LINRRFGFSRQENVLLFNMACDIFPGAEKSQKNRYQKRSASHYGDPPTGLVYVCDSYPDRDKGDEAEIHSYHAARNDYAPETNIFE